jgi:predicted NBD/HSP70 family sugar kinase
MEPKISSYKKRIIKELYFGGLLSCSDLSERIGKSLPLTARMLDVLIEEGLAIERGYAASTGGRKPIMYSLKPDVMYVVAVAMDQLITKIVLMDLDNKYVTDIAKFDLPLANNPGALFELAEKIDEFVNGLSIEKNKIIGIGIGMPGFVDAIKGINYTFLEATGESINQYISDRVKLPVFIDNDSSLIALAELRFGSAHNKKNAMVINASWGVGLGIIVNGQLFRGHNGFAGEFSHIPLFLNNKLCSCGKSGCLETESSLLVVIEKAQKELKEGKASLLKGLLEDQVEQACEAIIDAAGKGDKLAVELLSEAGYNIGRGVAILIHILNPEIVVLSGRGSSAGKIWLAPIQQALNEHCIPRLCENTEIRISAFGYHAELIGAAVLVMENYEKGLINALTKSDVTEGALISN